MPPTDEVVIIGAGAAGLSAAGALKRAGIEATVLDGDDRIGGSWARRYERLHLHTVRRFSGLAHHAIPRSYPRYVHKDDYAAYLADYAASSSCGSSWAVGSGRRGPAARGSGRQ